jgi:hypothetical protein
MDLLALERLKFASKCNKNPGRIVGELSECWLWNGEKNKDGYCHYQTKYAKEHGITYAHQASYHLFKDQTYKPSRQMQCSHLCTDSDLTANRCCVNPDHLVIESLAANMARRNPAHAKYNPHNRKFNEEQLKDIREMRESGTIYKDIAAKYNCNRRTIERIFTGQHYPATPVSI